MAREKLTTEETVKDIIDTGIDFRPETIRAVSGGAHIIKPYNFDGEYLVDANNNDQITVDIGSIATIFTHHLDREITGRIICDQDVAANISITSSTKSSVTLTATTDVNAKIIIY